LSRGPERRLTVSPRGPVVDRVGGAPPMALAALKTVAELRARAAAGG